MAAPSFSSFPSNFDSFPDLEPGRSSHSQSTNELESYKHTKHKEKKKADEKDRDRGRKQKKREKREKRHRYSDDKSNHADSRDGTRSSRHREERRSKVIGDDYERGVKRLPTPDNRPRLFFEDRKGDPLNITYSGLHAGDVPKYWLIAGGKKVLGLDRKLTVLYRGGKGVEIGERVRHNKAPQLTDSHARALLASGRTRRLTASAKALLKYEEVDGFVRIPSRKGKEKDQAYRSIIREDEEKSDSESSSESGSEASDYESDTSPMTAREESLRSLEQNLREDPTSISDWLLLVEHSLNGISATVKNADTARSDITVSILSRALSAHPNNTRSALLRLKYLKAGESLWHESKLKEEWDEALRIVYSADVCVEWLDWRMRTGTGFSKVLQDVTRALDVVAKGYVERSFAMFQAQSELSFNMPEDVKGLTFEKQLNALEEFWESELPRVGEAYAKGWKAWRAATKAMDEGSLKEVRRIDEYDSENPYKIWHFHERASDKCLFMPMRTLNMNEDDPYSMILFSDVRPFLFDMRTAKGRNAFRLVWLSFMGLHIPGLSSALSSTPTASDDRWADTAFMRPDFLKALFFSQNKPNPIIADSFNGVTVGREKTYRSSFETVKAWTLGVLEPLEGLAVDGQYRMWRKGYMLEFNSDVIEANRRIFEQVRQQQDELDWEIIGLAYEASNPESQIALKRSQSLLSTNSSSPELLAVHAYLERMCHRNDKARKVYKVGLSSLAQRDGPSLVCLWWGSAELEWLLSQSDVALEIVLRAAGQSGERGGVHILRAKRQLEEVCQQRTTLEWKFRLRWVKLRILLELLTGTLDAAIAVVERLQADEVEGELQHESLTVTLLLFVYHHTVTLRNHAPPAVLRELVRKALEIYSNNTIVLGLFLECEKGEGVWGRVRTLLGESAPGTLQQKTVARRIMDLWIANWEEGRWRGEVERVRAGLEAAVACDRTKGSAILWKVFVKFEIAAGNLKKARTVLFRALGECPLVKELYLLAFDDDLRSAFSKRELLSLSDTMAERGIRLRMSLGELVDTQEGWDEEGGSDEIDSDRENELEYESRELRRLMPY